MRFWPHHQRRLEEEQLQNAQRPENARGRHRRGIRCIVPGDIAGKVGPPPLLPSRAGLGITATKTSNG